MVHKVTAYIIRCDRNTPRLLVFAHDCGNPRYPLQVPAGTVEDGEDAGIAAWREIAEEAGLMDVRLIRYLGSRETYRDDLADTERRDFFLYLAPPDCPETWTHQVLGDGADAGLNFPYSWITREAFPQIVPLLAPLLTPGETPELFP